MKKTAKNFAIWTALHSDIKFFSLTPEFYSGRHQTPAQMFQEDEFVKHHGINDHWNRLFSIAAKIKEIGIDFDKSPAPKSDRVAEFNGTDNDVAWKEIVCGVLILNDGTEVEYYANCKLNMNQFEPMQEFFEAAE